MSAASRFAAMTTRNAPELTGRNRQAPAPRSQALRAPPPGGQGLHQPPPGGLQQAPRGGQQLMQEPARPLMYQQQMQANALRGR